MATPATARGGFILGSDRKLQPLWRAIIWFVVTLIAITLIGKLLDLVLGPPPPGALPLNPLDLSLGEAVSFAGALVSTGLFALYEHRRLDSYGMPIDHVFDRPTWEGFAVGVFQTCVVAISMLAYGAMRVHGLAAPVGTSLLWALAWLGACLCIGIAEEFLFRGYLLQTLWKAIGFWPAALVIAAIFAGVHYFLKPGENLWDVLALVSFTLVCCYSVLRTGNLWFAVGLHVAYDFMQLFVIGTPNGGHIPAHRLLDATFNGPAWLTGGPLGTEASWFAVPLDLLAFAYIWWRYRSNPDYRPA